jgi:FkbM family methyltransferase
MNVQGGLWKQTKRVLRRAKRRADIFRLGLLPGNAATRKQAILMIQERREDWPGVQGRFDEIVAGLGPKSLCIDFGANLGEFTEMLGQTGAEVHAFEPDPYTFGRLQERVGKFENVKLHNAAIGAEAGTLAMERHAMFDEDPERYSIGTSAFASALGQPGGAQFEVEMVGFHDLVEVLGRPIDLVKMDIEGAEVAILEKLLQRPTTQPIRALFVETHEPQMPELRPRLKFIRRHLKPSNTLEEIHLDWQ